jgi:hypothetical protein
MSNLGQRMIRVDDGTIGTVEEVTLPGSPEPERRIMYTDRGERRIAAKSEKWVSAEPAPLPLRAEEKFLIALHADKALRAYERNEPLKFWEHPKLSDEPYDNELIVAILAYLSEREIRASVGG